MISADSIKAQLAKVIDPELNIDIVSLGLVYDVTVALVQKPEGERPQVHIIMTLTTPGCPLSHVFEQRIKEVLDGFEGLYAFREVELELTFDPPWLPDMMTEEARAELGF